MKFKLLNEKFIKDPGGFSFGRDTCVITSILHAYNLSWNEAWKYFEDFLDLKDIENKGITNKILSYVLNQLGYIKSGYISNKEEITVKEFSKRYSTSTYIVNCHGLIKGKPLKHATCVKNGDIYDSFNPGNLIVDNYILVKE